MKARDACLGFVPVLVGLAGGRRRRHGRISILNILYVHL